MKSKHMTLKSKEKEKKMANRRFWLGMVVMVLAFGMTVVGCDENEEDKDTEVRWTWVENNTDDPITKVVFTTESNGGGQIILTDNQGVSSHSKKVYDLGLSSLPGGYQGDHSWFSCYVSVTVSGQEIHSLGLFSQRAKYRNSGGHNFGEVEAAALRKVGSNYILRSENKNYWTNKKAIDPLLIGKWAITSSSNSGYEFTENTFTNSTAGATTNYSGVYSESIRIFFSSGQRIFSWWHVEGNTLTLTSANTSENIICTKVQKFSWEP
jgi:hypothetical protein